MLHRDYSRAFLHIASAGADGATPYVLADLLTKLKRTHQHVMMTRCDAASGAAEFNVDGVVVHVSRVGDGCVRVKGPKGYEDVSPFREHAVPARLWRARDDVWMWEPLFLNWSEHWPKAATSFDDYFARHFGADVAWETRRVSYLSESALAAAIDKTVAAFQ